MKTAIQFLSLCLTAATLLACNSNQPAAKHTGDTQHADPDTISSKNVATTTRSASAISPIRLKDDHLNAIYRYYIDLTESLTAEDISGAKIAAAAIELGAGKVNGGQAVASSAASIIQASDIAAQRDFYATLSENFISLLKKTGVASGGLYVLHCPMARNDIGAFWLSSTKTVRNPYYGQNMLTCGSVTETLE